MECNLFFGNCLEIMPDLPDKSVDAIIADWPYGTTACKWDSIIPLEPLWKEVKRVIKPKGAIVLTADEPFTSVLILSNLEWFKYKLTWDKVNRLTGHLNAKIRPLKVSEDVLLFCEGSETYNPQMLQGKPYIAVSRGRKSSNYGKQADGVKTVNSGSYYPTNIVAIPADERGTVGRIHDTQKPVALMEYLVKTYTNPGDTVLDNTMGSGSTGVACVNTNRNFIGMEKDEGYFNIAVKRLQQARLKALKEKFNGA